MPPYEDKLFAPPAPLADVALRDPLSGVTVRSVSMLLDSGVDITVVPRNAVHLLGAAVNPGQGYEVTGFDGKPTALAAIQLDLLFLSRAFKGRFLIVDQPWGILGRDILNHLTMVLDGPRLTWSEQ